MSLPEGTANPQEANIGQDYHAARVFNHFLATFLQDVYE